MAAKLLFPAQTVGDAFARQYYTILQHSPELVHRFYKDMSKIGRVDSDDGSMLSTTTMNAINEKIQSYGSLKADVKFVDAQESYNDGVMVLVYGSMVNEDESRRNFTQTFFLAPQDNGFYVLNDIFRYVNDDDPDSNEEDGGISPVTSDQESPPIEENHHSEQSNGEVYNSTGELPVEAVKEEFQVEEKFEEKEPVLCSEPRPIEENHHSEQSNGEVYNLSGELPVEVVKEEFQVEEKFEEKEPMPEVVDETPQESWVVVESSPKVEGTSKKSYASVVMKDAPATMSLSTPPKSVSKIKDYQVPVLPAPTSVAVPQSSNGETVVDVNSQDLEGGGHSIYVRNLPRDIAFSAVEQVFQEFGPIRSNGIQILRNRVAFRQGQYPPCFGFVKFETAAAAQSAIEASPIFIEGRKVVIEEKKSTVTRAYSCDGNNPGRYPPGERGGSGLPSEGGRGRNGYEEARGYGGRGDGNKSEFGGKRGGYEEGRGYGGRGDGNKSEFGGRRGGYEEGRGYGGRGDGNKSEFGGRRGGYEGGRGYGGRGDGNRSEFGGRRGGHEGGRGYGGLGDSNKSEFGGRGGGGRGYQTRSEGYQKSDQTGYKSGRMNCGVESSHMSTRARPERVSA
ncbi:nuclear transport factor 2-like isoform X2 [Silene latifolia]|uniref:nuclear transport factor 2-like isoform X2 n=1 Tax=Silene latifolia TaxID=37657 RepID=UPI003D77D808